MASRSSARFRHLDSVRQILNVSEYNLDREDKLVYLEAVFTEDDNKGLEIQRQIKAAHRILHTMLLLWSQEKATKRTNYTSTISDYNLPSLFGCETWTLL